MAIKNHRCSADTPPLVAIVRVVMSNSAPADASELSYAYKPSLLGAGWSFRLTPAGLAWEVGRRSGHMPYRSISRVRMSFRPGTMQGHRFLTEIWAPDAPRLVVASVSWRSMIEQQQLNGPYTAFITELHRRIGRAEGSTRFEAGTNPLIYWPGLAIFAAVALGIAFLAVRALEIYSWSAAAFVGFFLGVFLWTSGNFFRRNRPRIYQADNPPQELLPKNFSWRITGTAPSA